MNLNTFRLVLLVTTIFLSTIGQASLIDKVAFIVDDNVFTTSIINRIKSNINARRMVSPMIYSKDKLNSKEISKILVNSILIRERLTLMGYTIGDDQVEIEIKSTEKRLGLSRQALLEFLKQNSLTFEEYFELTREAIEYSIFVSRIIKPLVSITDQEVKNSFYKQNINNKTLSFKYHLVDFSLSRHQFKKGMLEEFTPMLKQFQATGNMPANFRNLSTNPLGDVKEDGLTNKLQKLLKHTNEGSFSKPILMGNDYHVFYVKEKNLVESSEFQQHKNRIKAILTKKASEDMANLWYTRESNKHYIKYFL